MKSKTHSRPKTRANIGASERGGGATARDNAADVPPTPRFVPSLAELAQVLGVCRQTLSRWHREPGCPGRRSDGRLEVSAWQTFLQNRPAFGGGPDGYREKCRKIQLQNEKLQWEIEELKRNFTATADVSKWGEKLASAIRKIVAGSLIKLAPELRLLSVPDAESKLKDAEDEILTRLHTIGAPNS